MFQDLVSDKENIANMALPNHPAPKLQVVSADSPPTPIFASNLAENKPALFSGVVEQSEYNRHDNLLKRTLSYRSSQRILCLEQQQQPSTCTAEIQVENPSQQPGWHAIPSIKQNPAACLPPTEMTKLTECINALHSTVILQQQQNRNLPPQYVQPLQYFQPPQYNHQVGQCLTQAVAVPRKFYKPPKAKKKPVTFDQFRDYFNNHFA
jgi:hypothetical protein